MVEASASGVRAINQAIVNWIKLLEFESCRCGLVGAERTGYGEEFGAGVKCDLNGLTMGRADVNCAEVEGVAERF